MKNILSMKVVKQVCIIAMGILAIGIFVMKDSVVAKATDYSDLIDSQISGWTNDGSTGYLHQIYYTEKGENGGTGLCNIASTVNLINRRMVIDGVYKSGNGLTAIEAINSSGAKSADGPYYPVMRNGKKRVGYKYSGKTESWWTSTYAKNGKKYQLKIAGKYHDKTLEDETVVNYVKQLLDGHPEGIAIRFYSGKDGHVIVFTGYDSNGFFVIDSCDYFDGKKTGSKKIRYTDAWEYTEYKKYRKIDQIVYIDTIKDDPNSKPPLAKAVDNMVKTATAATQDPKITVTGEKSPSGTLKYKSNFGLRGTIKTDCGVITEIIGEVVDESGNLVQPSSAKKKVQKISKPSSKVDIKNTINNSISFGKLAKGKKYTYRVSVTVDNSGIRTTKQCIETTFEVK